MIAGLVPCSFIDYPGRLAAVLFLQGCNLHCPYCHNAQLIPRSGSGSLSRSEVLSWLRGRVGRLTGVVVSGGEPTLHPTLIELLTEIRTLGYHVKLDTNGTRPCVLRRLLELNLLNYVAMDLKDLPELYQQWLSASPVGTAIRASIALLKESQVCHEFRTTVQESRHNLEKLQAMQRVIPESLWYLQRAVFSNPSAKGRRIVGFPAGDTA